MTKEATPKYSGDESVSFWKTVNGLKLRHGEIYALGCLLQKVEQHVLTALNNAIEDSGGIKV